MRADPRRVPSTVASTRRTAPFTSLGALCLVAGAAGLVAAIALGLDALIVEPRRFYRRVVQVPVSAGALAGKRILHLSDLHYVPRDRWLRRRLAEIAAWTALDPPDLIALTGDFVEWDEDAPVVGAMLRPLQSRLGSFAVLGNHDYGNAIDPDDPRQHSFFDQLAEVVGAPLIRYLERPAKPRGNRVEAVVQALEEAGVTVLRNTARRIDERGGPFWIAGLDEPHQRRARAGSAFASIPDGDPVLLLSHSPEVLEQRPPRAAALILAGHTHGGQIRLPFLKPLVTHTRIDLPAYQGLIETPAGPMHISAGVGATIPLRFQCPPEVTTIELIPADPARLDSPPDAGRACPGLRRT